MDFKKKLLIKYSLELLSLSLESQLLFGLMSGIEIDWKEYNISKTLSQ